MKIYHGIEEFKKIPNAVVTLGTFDGVHIGHQKILARLKKNADATQGEKILITYWPHPRLVLGSADSIKLITPFEEKVELLKQFGLDHLIVINFTKEFSKTTSLAFIEKILVDAIDTKTLIIGYNHRFGYNREGGAEVLSLNSDKYAFSIEEIPKQEIEQIAISSTKIRAHLLQGEIHISNKYLGYPYSLHGKVVKGNQLGKKLGFPTANIETASKLKLIPSLGSYAVKIEVNHQTYNGMLNIGLRPTLGEKFITEQEIIEVHIFDFNKNIYGENIIVKFIKLIRKEEKFASLEILRNQLLIDKKIAKEILATTINFV